MRTPATSRRHRLPDASPSAASEGRPLGGIDGAAVAEGTSAALARVARGDLCAGCGACAAIAPGRVAMREAAPGFARPVQTGPVTPREDAAIAAVCPGLVEEVEAGGRRDHVLWGPYLEMRTGHATDPGLRHAASSGGALSAVLVHLLETGAVDGVIQTGASEAVPVGNAAVLSRDAAAVRAAAGSRYAPSSPLDGIERHLSGSERLAFVGKPCDAAALRALGRIDPRVGERIPFILSFFCAGVPSRRGAEAVLRALGAAPEETVAFRYRGNGWPGQAVARLSDGSERAMSYAESWGAILSRHVQHRCKICPDGHGAQADLVCADAWESDERGYPVFTEAPGTSLVVARTELGARLLAEAEAAGRLETRAFDVEGLAAIQPGQVRRRQALGARLLAQAAAGRPVPRYRGLRIWEAARQGGVAWSARNFAGSLRRALRKGRRASG